MTAPTSIDVSGSLHEQLGQASPDLLRAMSVAQERPEVDIEMAREVFIEAATLLHNGRDPAALSNGL